uniref:Receptor tyrosine kinase n=1 Tax=Jadera sanguinolenta TaxID=2137813 RepID=A0A2R4G8U5_9HEMI|nr:receptor tyrosine kinase [Jadera sanguinolenta]
MGRPGNCTTDICGPEAGCVQSGSNYYCKCPHEGRITKDLRCPRKTVTDIPKPFAVIPKTEQNYTRTPETWSSSVGFLMTNAILIAFISIFIVGVLVAMVCFYMCYRRKVRMNLQEKSSAIPMNTPVILTKELIPRDKFATNPSYMETSLSPASFPIISHDRIIFENSHCIGEGCFGKVFKGEFVRENGRIETVAIKVLKDSASKEAEEDFMREVEIMSAFQHENILSLLGVALKEFGKSPCMVFEFMPYGDLTEVLRSNSKHFWKPDSVIPKLNKDSLLSIARQIACGMKYLAAQHFVHRDLACRNCLVGNNLTVKIADFGMSRDVYTCDYYKIGGSRLLPVRWMSPESVTYGRFTLESDVWSFGVVLWEIYSLGKQPYFGHSNEEVIRLINKGTMLIPPDDCPSVICDLMRACWRTEPRERVTFGEIYEKLKKISTPQLPQPPPFPVIPSISEVEEYLSPNPRPPHDYIQPLPD